MPGIARTVTAFVSLTLATAGILAAQTWIGDSASTRLDWHSVDVLVYPDTTNGVFVWFLTPGLGPWERHRTASSFLDPAELDPWLEQASAVVTATAPPLNDTVTALLTRKLHGSCGRDIALLRRRTKHGWSSDIDIILSTPSGKDSWTVIASRDQARDFLQGLYLQEGRSRVRPSDPSVGDLTDGTTIDQPPRLLPGHSFVPLPRTPSTTRTPQHEIALLFIIRSDGTPDPATFHAALYEDPRDVEVAVAAIRKFRYQPGMVNGRAVDTFVSTSVQY